MTSAAPAPARSQVSPEDFAEILRATREFVRSRVVPRENEIMAADALPPTCGRPRPDSACSATRSRRSGAASASTSPRTSSSRWSSATRRLALRSMFGTNNGIAGQVLVNFGTDEQKARLAGAARLRRGRRVLRPHRAGRRLQPGGLRTRAVRDGDDWVINGPSGSSPTRRSPDCSSSSPARDPAAARRSAASPSSSCPRDTPGVEVGPNDRKMGQEGAWTADVTFDRRPRAGRGARSAVGGTSATEAAMTSLARGRVHIAALARRHGPAGPRRVGRLRRHRHAGRHADRRLPARPGACSPTCRPACSPAQALVRECARKYDSPARTAASPRRSAKLFCTEMAGQVADQAVQVHGGTGYMREVPGRADLPRRPAAAPLRGHQRDPAAHHRRRPGAKRTAPAEPPVKLGHA